MSTDQLSKKIMMCLFMLVIWLPASLINRLSSWVGFAGLFVFIYQCYVWLVDGFFPRRDLAWLLDWANFGYKTDFIGLNKIVSMILDLHMFWGGLFFYLVTLLITVPVNNRLGIPN